MRLSHLKKAMLISTVATIALAAPAFAQDTAEGDDDSAETSTILVTGTRIARPDLQLASPVTAITAQEITNQAPNSAEDLLRDLPAVRPSLGPSVNNGSNGSASVNLRGIGDNRTLVLLDGRRIVPFGLDGTVDLNVMPVGLLERVDVVTGGASSVYGADAVAGVVNFITKKDFSGAQFDVSRGFSSEGDATKLRLDMLLGANFDDGRGNAVLGISYGDRSALYQTDRVIGAFPISSTTGLFQGSQAAVPTFITSPGNAAMGLPASSFGAVYDPTLGALRAATAADTYNTNINTYFVSPLESIRIYSAARYEIAPTVEVYSQAMFVRNKARIQLASSATFTNTYQLSLNNPYLTTALRNQLCKGRSITQANCDIAAAVKGGPGTTGYLEIPVIAQRRFTEYGARGNPVDSDMFQVVGGVRGDITSDIHFDVSGQYGETKQNQTRENWGSFSKTQQALRAYKTAAGANVCTDTSNGCVPINLFGPQGSITKAMLDFIDLDAQINRIVRQSVVTGNIEGDLFGLTSPLAEKPIAFSVGAEYRKISARANPDAASQIQGEVLGTGARTPPDFGEYDVKEGYGEIIVPLLTDKLIKSITVEGGVRFSDYSTTGKSTTWKAGGTIEPVNWLRLRGMYQVAVRSPNILELYQGAVQGLSNLTVDPCAGPAGTSTRTASQALCEATGAPAGSYGSIPQPSSGQINVTTSGNPNLDVERARTLTLGAVFQPTFISFLRTLSVTVDYFHIKVKDAISNPSQNDILNGCYSTTLNPSQQPNGFCQLISRNPLNGSLNGAGDTLGVILGGSNLGVIDTAGIDVGFTYSIHVPGFFSNSRWVLAGNGTYLDYYHFQATPNSINRNCTGMYSTSCTNPRPEWKSTLRSTYETGPIDISLLWNHVSGVDYEPIAPTTAIANEIPQFGSTASAYNALVPAFRHIDAYNYFDLSIGFEVNDMFSLRVLAENLLNRKPPLVGSGVGGTAFNSGNTFPTVYDPVGRAYTISVRVKL